VLRARDVPRDHALCAAASIAAAGFAREKRVSREDGHLKPYLGEW